MHENRYYGGRQFKRRGSRDLTALNVGGSTRPGRNIVEINWHIDGQLLDSNILLSLSFSLFYILWPLCEDGPAAVPCFGPFKILKLRETRPVDWGLSSPDPRKEVLCPFCSGSGLEWQGESPRFSHSPGQPNRQLLNLVFWENRVDIWLLGVWQHLTQRPVAATCPRSLGEIW